jgi:hypothetical protein
MTTILDIVKEVNGQSSNIHSIKKKKVQMFIVGFEFYEIIDLNLISMTR